MRSRGTDSERCWKRSVIKGRGLFMTGWMDGSFQTFSSHTGVATVVQYLAAFLGVFRENGMMGYKGIFLHLRVRLCQFECVSMGVYLCLLNA